MGQFTESRGDRLKEKVWRDIDKSGIELEIKAAEVFRQTSGWAVSPIYNFVDLDSRKGREIDFWVNFEKELEIPDYSLLFSVSVLVECKKIPGNAWIFFPASKADAFGLFSYSDALGGGMRANGFPNVFTNLLEHRVAYDTVSVHNKESVTDRKKSNGRTDNLYKGLVSLAKCLDERQKRDREGDKLYRQETLDELEVNPELMKKLMAKDGLSLFDSAGINLLLLVFDGPIFIAGLGNRELTEAGCIRTSFGYQSSKYSLENVPIDVCSIGHLPNYVKQLDAAVADFLSLAKGTEYNPGYGERDYDKSKTWLENRRLGAYENLSKWWKSGLS